MKILAIDLAYKKPVQVAVMSSRGKLLYTKEIQPENDIYHLANAVLEQIVPLGKGVIVIAETPLLINNISTAFVMTRLYAMIEKGSRDSGVLFFGIHPRTWQSAMLGKDKKWKAESVRLASEWLGKEVPNNDVADAINLARYAFSRRKEILGAIAGKAKFSEKEVR